MNSQTIDLDLRFKGDRDYLHGTDVYEALLGGLRRQIPDLGGRIRYAFHRIARTALRAEIGDAGVPPKVGPVVAEMVVGGHDAPLVARAHETGEPVTGRYAYDEDSIRGQCHIDGSRISMAGATPFKPIEVAVAMTKLLHNHLQPPETGKWMFTRLDLSRPFEPADIAGMTVTQVRQLGAKLTMSEVGAVGQKIGAIYFSVVAPDAEAPTP